MHRFVKKSFRKWLQFGNPKWLLNQRLSHPLYIVIIFSSWQHLLVYVVHNIAAVPARTKPPNRVCV
jgi:hypothetical protein